MDAPESGCRHDGSRQTLLELGFDFFPSRFHGVIYINTNSPLPIPNRSLLSSP